MEAGYAIADGIRRVHGQDAEIVVRPLADGGEGTVEALVSGMSGVTQNVMVTGPLGIPVNCEYGIIESSHTAVIEMSGAAGITLVPDEKRNPLYTTTYGVGEVIKDAIAKGCRRFIVGIGGSATNDGGVGMLQALGYGFLIKKENRFPLGRGVLKYWKRLQMNMYFLNWQNVSSGLPVMSPIFFAERMAAVLCMDHRKVQLRLWSCRWITG